MTEDYWTIKFVKSSNIRFIGVLDGSSAEVGANTDIVVGFISGNIYVYHNCAPSIWNGFILAESKGKYLNKHLRGIEFTKIQ